MKPIKHIATLLMLIILFISSLSCGNSKSEELELQRLEHERILMQQEQKRIQEQQEQKRKEEIQRQNDIQSINYVLRADSEASKTSGGDFSLIARKMRTIDISKCPIDFATAYIDHVHAWEDAAKVRKAQVQLQEYGGVAAAAGLVATLAEAEASPFSDYLKTEAELMRLAREKRNDISSTWHKIERLAVSYGATLPQ